ncbi:alpha/beta family hydrolase [Psychromonas sp. Urea-02u-13]|uniref:alpha/beta family hydrolase n=1 Tax=Psychromonas sp. Urea-02u-13 TaxID=2058326 RepID=UPI000C32E22B|nr:alpha/beta family hydrolase [Psychromonas sp. Urea-02u-13]PKG36957.1 alpha/beta hydrolase [Psychromonas sp. Urea-02u-13]
MEIVFNGPEDGPLFVFSHGAGAPLTSDFMEQVAVGLANKGIRVARFNYNYMQQRVETGSRRPPERAPKLLAQFDELIKQLNQPMVIGGKSMGGRMASLLVADPEFSQAHQLIKGVACVGYPFHPQGKPEKLRTEHLPDIKVPLLMVQGDRDKLGSREEVDSYGLPESIQWCWLEDGDHDLKPRVKSGFKHQQHIETAIVSLYQFIMLNQ